MLIDSQTTDATEMQVGNVACINLLFLCFMRARRVPNERFSVIRFHSVIGKVEIDSKIHSVKD